MIKTSKTTILAMGVKLFQKLKCSFILHQNSMFYNDPISSSSPMIFTNKNGLMFYSNSNNDKNYVI